MDPTPTDAPSLPDLIKTYLARFTSHRPANRDRYFREVRCFCTWLRAAGYTANDPFCGLRTSACLARSCRPPRSPVCSPAATPPRPSLAPTGDRPRGRLPRHPQWVPPSRRAAPAQRIQAVAAAAGPGRGRPSRPCPSLPAHLRHLGDRPRRARARCAAPPRPQLPRHSASLQRDLWQRPGGSAPRRLLSRRWDAGVAARGE